MSKAEELKLEDTGQDIDQLTFKNRPFQTNPTLLRSSEDLTILLTLSHKCTKPINLPKSLRKTLPKKLYNTTNSLKSLLKNYFLVKNLNLMDKENI
jgi:hypothetical protein